MLKANEELAIIFFTIIIVIIFIIFITISIITFCGKSKIKYYDIIKSAMRIILPIICFTFFGQIFESLILIFLCNETGNSSQYYSFKCPANYVYYIYCVLSIVSALMFIIISYIVISMFYKPPFMKDKNKSLNKINSYADLTFLINKILFIILTNIKYKDILFIWFTLIVLLIATYYNMVYFTKYNNYENKIISELNKFFSIILFCFTFDLIFGKIFNAWGFNGTLNLFLFGILIGFITSFLYKDNLSSFSYIDFKALKTSCERIIYINKFLELIKKKHFSREKTLIFETLILIREENCINKNCKLKKYLKSLEKGEANDFLLFQYCQYLYEISIKKFPEDVILKVNYIIYLINQMSKRKLAEKVLYTMKNDTFNVEKNYVIFCCKKYIENYTIIKEPLFKEENKNVMKKIEYDKLYDEFKNDIIQASSLYYELWNILNKYHTQGVEEFHKLKTIGKELNSLIKIIEEKFNILHNVKGDDSNLLHIYSEFIRYILGDKDKYNHFKNLLASISNIDKIKDFEIDYTNFDLQIYEQSDEFKYLIVSAEEENFGSIINISHNASKIFGYKRCELIGQNISILMPGITQKEFEIFLRKKTNKLKIKFYDCLTNKKEYLPQIDELFISVKSKSKFLLPIYIKMMLVQTEESYHNYIMTMHYHDDINLNKINDIFKLGSISNQIHNKEENIYKYCIVLTDMNFIIQTFTSNCQEHLRLNTHSMNSNIDITQFISEFNESVNKIIFEKKRKLDAISIKNDINFIEDSYRNVPNSGRRSKSGKGIIDNMSSADEIIMYKRYIADNNYSESKLITWKTDIIENYLANNKGSLLNTIITPQGKKLDLTEKNEDLKDKFFLLIIQKLEFNNKQIGYTFLFRREQVNLIEKDNNDLLESNINDDISPTNKNNKKKLKSHKTTFFSYHSSDHLNYKKQQKDNKTDDTDNTKEILKHSKSQKKILKLPKSLDSEKDKKGDNIIGVIQTKIKKLLNDDSKEIINPIKKSSSKNFSSPLSLEKNEISKKTNFSDLILQNKLFKTKLEINNYIPKCDFNFSLDMKLWSFKPSYTLCKANDLNETLKIEAKNKMNILLKINKQKTKTKSNNSSFIDSSNQENESFENDEYSSSIPYPNDSNRYIKKKTLIEKNKKDDIDKQYYRVSSLSKIKFMIFDFEREMVVEIEEPKGNKSEVENIFTNYKLKLPTAMDKDGNDPSIKINKLIMKYSNKELLTKEKYLKVNAVSQNQNEKKIKKQKESCKRLETELNKKGKEKSIFLYSILCVFLNLVLLGFGIFSLYFVINQISTFKTHLLKLIYTSLLRYHTNLGLYHTRMYMLTTLNVSGRTYENYELNQNRTKYIEKLYKNLENDFFSGAKYLEQMIQIDIKLNEQNEYKLYKKPFNNVIVGRGFNFLNVTTSFMVGITQIYSHFYYLISNIDGLEYDSVEMLNFIYNALNSAGIELNEIINIFIDEIRHKKKGHIQLTYVILSIYLLILIIMFFLIQVNYKYILHKRDSYISIFYQINISFIRTALLKCEKFIGQLNPNEAIPNAEDNHQGLNKSLSISNLDDNLLSNEQITKNTKSSANQRNIRKGAIKIKRDIRLMVLFILFLLIIFLYMLIPLLEFNNYISKFEILALYVYHMLNFHNNIINIYNSFNEYFFYSQSNVDNIPILEYLDMAINNIYNTFSEDLNYQATNSKKIPGMYDIFSKIQKGKLCNSTNTCDHYIETVTSLGFYCFVPFLINEIKIKINYEKILAKRFNESWESNIDDRSIFLFNNLHYDIDYMFNYVVLYYIDEEINSTGTQILATINSRNHMYITIYTIYIIAIVLLYLCYWNQYIFDIQDQIYKTKTVLNIIPVEILESQTNINIQLGVCDLN